MNSVTSCLNSPSPSSGLLHRPEAMSILTGIRAWPFLPHGGVRLANTAGQTIGPHGGRGCSQDLDFEDVCLRQTRVAPAQAPSPLDPVAPPRSLPGGTEPQAFLYSLEPQRGHGWLTINLARPSALAQLAARQPGRRAGHHGNWVCPLCPPLRAPAQEAFPLSAHRSIISCPEMAVSALRGAEHGRGAGECGPVP